ncbi:sodium channel protein 60E-like isoform X2 [Rhodnius prolixus]|uniref:sodium channel protein 60E-like isoform X2 n=1 Tax=Rhodnius prolixus TaxID=13249 RepID=UPI003D1889DC
MFCSRNQCWARPPAGEESKVEPGPSGGQSAGGDPNRPRSPARFPAKSREQSTKQRVRLQVKPLTKLSLDQRENRTAQLVRDYGFQPKRKLSVEDGSVLPTKYEPFPSHLYGKPLEEIDNFIFDETFCVVSKRFRKKYIHRFTATSSLFLFSPWNSIRRTCIFLSTNQYFDYTVMATILINCVFLAKTETVEEAEYMFLAIYTAEMLIKCVAKGFILNKYTYLRNPWNWLDFIVITSGYATIGLEVGNLAGLRTFRVLRALKTVSIMPGLKTIINALLHSFKQLAEVMTLTIFCLMVFALFALQVYMGELRNKCVPTPPQELSHRMWWIWITNESAWLVDDENNPLICGNVTGARQCPTGYTCLRVGENPNNGYTNFDNFLWSMLTTFQLITLDYWENVYNMVIASCGPLSVVFFTVVVFFGSFYLINLMLAVVALSYEEEAEITNEERRKDLTEHRDDSTFSFDPSKIPVKQLEKENKRKIDSRKGLLLSSYTRKRTRRRKRRGIESPTHSRNDSSQEPQEGGAPKDNNCSGEGGCERSVPHRNERERESSLEDSGVVDDHEEPEFTAEDQSHPALPANKIEHPPQSPAPPASKPLQGVEEEVKCNGVNSKRSKPLKIYTLPQDYKHVVTIGAPVDRNCEGCSQCCLNYDVWLRQQNSLYRIVRDPLFELLITVCILLNTVFLATEHHGMSYNIKKALDIGNKVFTSIFTLECTLKLLALSKDFFVCGWNIFDLIIVSASLIDLSFEMVDGLSVLRCLRLLRVLKLAQSWTTMKVLLSIIISTFGALGNLTFVLVIIIYIFAVIGMQLFSKDYTEDKFAPDPVPRWNFNDFFHSFMMIFRILCGEWIEPLWDCMRAEEQEGAGTCFAIFLPALVMGNFMVLNLFLALLLNSFNSEELKSKKEEVGDESKIAKSFDRIRSIIRKQKRNRAEAKDKIKSEDIYKEILNKPEKLSLKETTFPAISKINEEALTENEEEFSSVKSMSRQNSAKGCHQRNADSSHNSERESLIAGEENTQDPLRIIVESESGTLLKNDSLRNSEHDIQENDSHESTKKTYEVLEVQSLDTTALSSCEIDLEPRISLGEREDALYARIMSEAMRLAPTLTGPDLRLPPVDEESPITEFPPRPMNLSMHRHSYALATRKESFQDELAASGTKRDAEALYLDAVNGLPDLGKSKLHKVPHDCFPGRIYKRVTICEECMATACGQWWYTLRSRVLSVVDTPTFEWIILVLIFASSITLCFEDIYLDQNLFLKSILYWTNLAFCALFSVEMVLKWIALGFYKYFTSFWTVLDFIIVFVSIFSLLIEENENLKVLRSLRTLRALRPLRAISRWQGMRIVVNALMYAIPSIFNVLLVCLVFWLIFSIMGVQFFGGKFFKCLDEFGERLPVSVVKNRFECIYENYSWVNSKITFDNVGNGYLALFQVATFEGWIEVMADAVDATGVDEQPTYEANLYAYFYFVVFIVCGSFFTLNLFIGVIIDNFNMLKKKYEGGVLEMFLTESQKHYYTAMKKLGRKKPQKVIKRPINQFLAMFYDLSNSRRFEIAIFALIFLNMLTMGIEHYNQHHAVFFVLEVSNAFFTTVFGLEAIVKIIGLRYHYFTVPWNLFDFLLVLASILGILMEDIMIDFPISPTLLRVVRVFRIGRILRLIKAAKGIRKLLFALVVSLPALFNIGALLALITFIYAIIGMSVFGHVKHQRALDDMVNFETFGRSMQLLFRLMTSAGWNDVLESLMVQPPECDPTYNGQLNGNCGHPLLAITYFTSFIIISYMIVINMYIAIILENFNQAHQEEEIGIVEDDLEMFYIRWSKFDPHATQFIRFGQLSDFIASLDPPLGIGKPNIVALVSFNLPIARGNKIHCLDILHALVKHVLGHVEETEDFKKLQDQMDIKFKKQFPTRKELEIISSTRIWKRQDRAAKLIQKTFREYRRRKREGSLVECDDGGTQSSSPGGWQGRLSALLHVHRGSRTSSRKSSRTSDASDMSELGTAWLNLPLLLLSGTQPNGTDHDSAKWEGSGSDGDGPVVGMWKQSSLDLPSSGTPGVSITVTEPSPDSNRCDAGTLSGDLVAAGQSNVSSANQPLLASRQTNSATPASPVASTLCRRDSDAQIKRAAFRRTSDLPRLVQALVHRESEEYEPDS